MVFHNWLCLLPRPNFSPLDSRQHYYKRLLCKLARCHPIARCVPQATGMPMPCELPAACQSYQTLALPHPDAPRTMLSNPAGTSTPLHPTHVVIAHPFPALPQPHPIDAPWVAGIGSGDGDAGGKYSAASLGSFSAACRVAAHTPAAGDVVDTFARLVTHRRVHTFRVWCVFGLCRCSYV